MKKIKIKALNGFVWVEDFNGKHNEETDRAKIYDENMGYIDYISLEDTNKKTYNNIVNFFKNVKNFDEFINVVAQRYDYAESLTYLLESMFDDASDEVYEELQNDLKTMTEKELIEEYCINRIGNYYFYIED